MVAQWQGAAFFGYSSAATRANTELPGKILRINSGQTDPGLTLKSWKRSVLVMSDASPPTILVMLQPDDGLGRIVVGLRPFLRFGEEISFGLEDLVSQQRAGTATWAPVGMIIRETTLHPWPPETTP